MRLFVTATVALVLSAVLATPAGAAVAEVGPGVRVVGRLPIISPPDRVGGLAWGTNTVRLALSPERRRAYMLFQLEGARVGIRSFDLDTLRETGYVTFTGAWGGGRVVPIPELGVMLWRLADDTIGVLDEDAIASGSDPLVRTIAIPPGQREVLRPAGEGALGLGASGIGRLRPFQRDGRWKLLVSFSPQAGQLAGATGGIVGATIPYLAQWDFETGDGDWLTPVDGCRNGPPLGDAEPMLSQDMSRVYTVCNVSGYLAGVVRIALGPDGAPDDLAEPEVFPGPIGVRQVFADEAAERVVMVSQPAGTAGASLWAFDGTTSRYAGISGLTQGTSAKPTYGFDSSTGRVYVLAADHWVQDRTGPDGIVVQGGMMMVDSRRTPLPQPISFPALGRPSDVPIQVDPGQSGARIVLVRRAHGAEEIPGQPCEACPDTWNRYPDGKAMSAPDERFFLVIEERVPVGAEPTLADQDRLTLDVDEREGVTSSSYDAGGSAYGARALLVGGLGAVARNQAEVLEFNLNQQGRIPACWNTTRDVFFGVVKEARLTDFEASAEARATHANEATMGDLMRPTERCMPPAVRDIDTSRVDDAVGQEWPHPAVHCVGDEADEVSDPSGASSAQVSCGYGSGALEASGRGSAGAAGGVSIAEAESSVAVHLDAKRGLVVTSVASAHGIHLPGEVSVGLVRSEAVVWSNGRPATDRARLSQTVCFVSTPDYTQEGCRDPQAAVEAMDRAFGNRGSARMPAPDPQFQEGSPGGYVAGVTKDRLDAVQDELFHGDQALEVPALEIIFYRDSDNFGPGRQIFQVAGVQAVTTYGISCVPPFGYAKAKADCVETRVAPLPGVPVVPDALPPQDLGAVLGPGPDPSTDTVRPTSGPGTVEVLKDVFVRALGDGLLLSLLWLTFGTPLVLASRAAHLSRARRA